MQVYRQVSRALLQPVEDAAEFFKRNLKEKEVPLAYRIYRGVKENEHYLKGILEEFSKMPLVRYRKDHQALMLIGLYGILFLDKADHAIVNQLVEDIKAVAPGLSGMSNGIFRNVLRKREEISTRRQSDASRYSIHPDLLKALQIQFSKERLRHYLEKTLQAAPFEIFCLGDRDDLSHELQSRGFEVNPLPYAVRALRVHNPSGILEDQAFLEGKFYVMSQSAQLVSQIAAALPGERVLDLCASPGGKSIALRILAPDKKLQLNDLTKEKLIPIKENFKRLKLSKVTLSAWDATRFQGCWQEAFDLVLLDAPCSGSGILHRVSEIKSRRDRSELKNVAGLQRRILHQASRYVKKNGFLIYATCSILDAENECQIEHFLDSHRHFQKIKLEDPMLPLSEGSLFMDPTKEEVDGFFACVMQKVEA